MRPRTCHRLRLDNRAVAPEGSLNARLYLVGEAPGRHEAEMGRPFVGPVGAALRDMMREAGIDVSQVRLANAIPFRPIERSPGGRVRNRRPTDNELRNYAQSVLVDIVRVQPKLIVALGRSAGMLFGAPIPVRRSRKRTLQFKDMPVRFTYHPGFVLRFGGRGSPRWRSAVSDLKKFWNEAQKRRSAHAGGRS